ncbi:MAG: DUF3237 family protein [Lachnospiraceae bacterium]|nr:DUF3237 family protein [Lachnospiraceae bacterium]
MNEKEKAPVLELLIQTDPAKTVELEGAGGKVRMIPFTGTAEGPLFHGIIEPCGVDTQVTNAANVRHMSARYMLTGEDHTGTPCRIYVQNEAWFEGGARPVPWHSVPVFMTDSEALAPVLHRNCFIGEGIRDSEGLHIRFYEAAP